MSTSPFYESRRRFAYAFALASVLLLVSQLYLGFTTGTFADPRASELPDGVMVAHQLVVPGDEAGPGTRVVLLDRDLRIRRAEEMSGDARGVLLDGDDVTAYFGSHVTVLRGGNSVRGESLGQSWDVRGAVQDPAHAEAWVFGWADGHVVARRRVDGVYSAEIPVQAAGKIDGLSCSMQGARGPLVVWSESGSTRVRTAFFDGKKFSPRAEFDIGKAIAWEVVAVRERLLLVSYLQEERTFRTLTLHLQCCKECGQPPPPEQVTFLDPASSLGRGVTGLAAAVQGDDLVVFLTRASPVLWRESSLQYGRIPAASLLPPPDAPLVPIGAEPVTRRVAGNLWLIAMMFCVGSLISLGFVMLRERGRAALAKLLPEAPGPAVADLLSRALALVLDSIIISPITFVIADLTNWTADPAGRWEVQWLKWTALTVPVALAYLVPTQAAFGWTLGKKVLGLRVAAVDGSRAPLWSVVVRSLLWVLDVSPLVPIGILLVFRTRRRQRLGDLLGRTIVVFDRPPARDPVPARAGRVEGGSGRP